MKANDYLDDKKPSASSFLDSDQPTGFKQKPLAELLSTYGEPNTLNQGAKVVSGLPGVLEVGARRGYAGIGKIEQGALSMLGDLLNSQTLQDASKVVGDRANQIENSAVLRGQKIQGFAPDSIANDIPEAGANAVSSVIQTAPSLLAGAVVPGAALPALFGQTYAQEFAQGKDAGLSGGKAALRALPMAGFEVVGEKLGGFDRLADSLRAATKGNGVADLGASMLSSAVREIPSEELTTTGQFVTDLAPSIGLNQDATLADYGNQLKDTALATALQAGAMGAGGSTIRSLSAPRQSVMTNIEEPSAPIDTGAIVSSLNQAINTVKPSAAEFLDAEVTEAPSVSQPIEQPVTDMVAGASGSIVDNTIGSPAIELAQPNTNAGSDSAPAVGTSNDSNLSAGVTPAKRPAPVKKKQTAGTLLSVLDGLGGIDNQYKWDISGEQKFARGGYNKIFKNAATATLEQHIENGSLDEFLPYEFRSTATDDPTEGRNYLADRIRNGDRVLPYDVELEAKQNRAYEANSLQDDINTIPADDGINDDLVNALLREAGYEELEQQTDSGYFTPQARDTGGTGSAEVVEQESPNSGIAGSQRGNASEVQTIAQNEIAGSNRSNATSQEREGVRPYVESIVKRRAAANQIGKGKAFDNALGFAKEFLNGNEVSPTKFKNAATMFANDKPLSEAFSALETLAKAPAKQARQSARSAVDFFTEQIKNAQTVEQLKNISRSIQMETGVVTDAMAQELDDAVMARMDELTQPEAEPVANQGDDFIYNGSRIYKIKIRSRQEGQPPTEMWAAESTENTSRRLKGERTLGGDGLFDTVEEAKADIDAMQKRNSEIKKVQDEQEQETAKKERAEKEADAKRSDLDGFGDNLDGMRLALLKKNLDKPTNINGQVLPLREHVRKLVEQGGVPHTFEENAIKGMTRAEYNRANEREQKENDKRIAEGGKKTTYSIKMPNESMWELGKNAHDFAKHLIDNKKSDVDETNFVNTDFALSTQTNEEILAREKALKDVEAAKAKEEANAKAEADKKALEAQQRKNANEREFVFGEDNKQAEQAIKTGSEDMFAQAEDPKPSEPVAEVTKPTAEPKTALSVYDNIMEEYRNGIANVDDYKAAFNYVLNNEQSITEYLEANFTKAQLLERGVSDRYKSEPKARMVSAAYSDMVRDFLLPDANGMISSSYGFGGDKYADIKRQVSEITQESLDAAMNQRQERIKQSQAKREERIKGIADPKTLDDFQAYMREKISEGSTYQQARMTLTPEQRLQFDELVASFNRDQRRQSANQNKTKVQATATTTSGEIIETKHTKTNEPLFVVKTADRVERDVYNQWNATAKRMGGYYSSYRGGGAVPGFQFKSMENADAFLKYIGGDTEQAKEAIQIKRDAYADDRTQTAVERLTEMANRLDESADAELGRDRKSNTARRAGMAARAEANANADKAMAITMRNIAEAIESGKAKYLDQVRQKTQVELLQTLVSNAQYKQGMDKYKTYAEYEKHKYDPATSETADYADFPTYTLYRSDWARLGRAMTETEGLKQLGTKILSTANDVTDAYLKFAKENMSKVGAYMNASGLPATFTSKANAEGSIARSGFNGQAIAIQVKRGEYRIIDSPSAAMEKGLWSGDSDKTISFSADFMAEVVEKIGKANRKNNKLELPWQLEASYDKRMKLKRMDIETPAEMRAALREFIGLKESIKAPDKIKQLERSMIGRRNDGLDFFPTPASTADTMIDIADIKEGMTIIEPSAGMGHIADRIREAGFEPDVVELSGDRRELLQEKGYNIVGNDFLEVTGKYDRIIMNPPFSDRRDMEHVQHAYDLLSENGRLVAIVGEGVFFGSDKKATGFREWLDSVGGSSEKLEEGTFNDPSLPVNTSVNARIVVIDKASDASFKSSTPTLDEINAAEQSYSPLMVDEIERAIASDTYGHNVDVYANITDTPEYIQRQIYRERLFGAEGFFDSRTNRVALIAENIDTVERAREVARHELIGHYGIENMLKDKNPKLFDELLSTVLQSYKSGRNADVMDAAKYVLKNQQALRVKSDDTADQKANKERRLAKEIIATMAERNVQNSVVKRVMDAIRQFLNKIGFIKTDLTDAEIAKLLRDAQEYLQEKAQKIERMPEGAVASFASNSANFSGKPQRETKQSMIRDELGRIKSPTGIIYDKTSDIVGILANKVAFGQAPKELRTMTRLYKAEMQKGMDAASNVVKTMSPMSTLDRSLVSDVVEKMVATGVTPPEHIVKIATGIQTAMDTQTDELVRLGMLSRDSAERWRGKYLPRFYMRDDEQGVKSWISGMMRNRLPVKGIGGNSLKGRGIFEEVYTTEVPKFEALGWEVRDPLWKKNQQGELELVDANKAMNPDKVVVWRDYAPTERATMGENRDALFRFVMGYTSMQNDIALGRLFDSIAKNQEWTRARPSEGYVKVPESEIPDTGGVKRYGNLSGLYVKKEILDHISQYEESSELWKYYRKALSFWKMGKTVLNPVAHINNVVSNLSMAHFAGVSYWDAHKYIGAIKDFANNAPMIQEAKDRGLMTGDITRAEIMADMPDDIKAMMEMQESKIKRGANAVFNILTFGLTKPMSKAYRFEDDFFKYLIYRDARKNGLSPDDAVDYATKYIFTYDDLPKGARVTRDIMIPFFAYTYKAVPALTHTAFNYPWRLAAPAAAIFGINAIGYGLAAGDDDDDLQTKYAKGKALEEEERKNLPPWMQGRSSIGTSKSIRLGTDDKTQLPVYMDISRMIPGGDIFDATNQTDGLPLPAPIMPSNPVLTTIAAMLWNKDTFTGKEVVDLNDTTKEASKKRAEWMLKQLSPAIAPTGYHFDRLSEAVAQMSDKTIETPWKDYTGYGKDGLPVQPSYAAVQTIGIKARPIDLERSAEMAQGQDNKEIRSILAEIRQASRLLDQQAISQREYDRRVSEAETKIEAIQNK